MPGENIWDWSTTASNNDDADSSINWAEGMARATVNDSARSMMAAVAKCRNLQNGSITTGGTANAQTVTSGMSFTTVPTGMNIRVKIGVANTGSATLNMDGIGGVTIKNQAGDSLTGKELILGTYADFIYDGTNWILKDSSNHPGTAKAWFHYNEVAAAIGASYGVSSISDDGTGVFTVNFSTAFASTAYAAVFGGTGTSGTWHVKISTDTTPTASACVVNVFNYAPSAADGERVMGAFFGEQ